MKKWEIIITAVLIIVVAILVITRLFVIDRDGNLGVPTEPNTPNLTEESKLEMLSQLTESSTSINERVGILNNLSQDKADLSLVEKQKILNALVGANK